MQDIVKNTRNIMKQRGYNVKEQEKLEKNKILLICEKGEGKSAETAQVLILGEVETLGVAMVREIVKEMNKKKIKNKLIIGSGKVTRSAKNEMIANKIDFIPTQLVLMNILEHEFVPKHEIISPEEAKQILEKYRITEDLLPNILDTDPVAKIIGAKPGDFVKITRKSATAGESVIYRLCVKGEE
ncbi:MAG: DNA-directed RNA polymerase subunit H [Promethearchaeota archaeon]